MIGVVENTNIVAGPSGRIRRFVIVSAVVADGSNANTGGVAQTLVVVSPSSSFRSSPYSTVFHSWFDFWRLFFSALMVSLEAAILLDYYLVLRKNRCRRSWFSLSLSLSLRLLPLFLFFFVVFVILEESCDVNNYNGRHAQNIKISCQPTEGENYAIC